MDLLISLFESNALWWVGFAIPCGIIGLILVSTISEIIIRSWIDYMGFERFGYRGDVDRLASLDYAYHWYEFTTPSWVDEGDCISFQIMALGVGCIGIQMLYLFPMVGLGIVGIAMATVFVKHYNALSKIYKK